MFRNANKSLGAWAGWVKDEYSKKKIEGFSNPIINPTTIPTNTPTPIYIKNAYNNAYLSPDCSGATPVNQNITDINQATLYTLLKSDTTYTIKDTNGNPYYIGNRFCNTNGGQSTSPELDISANTVSGNAAATYSIQKKGVTTNSDYLIADEIGSSGSGVYNIYPSILKSIIPLQNVTKIACGNTHTVALANGVLKSWGANDNGQLGDGTNDSRNRPVNVVGDLTKITQIACGGYYTVVVADGVLQSWGANDSGQLGDGTFTDRNTPGDVSRSLTTITHIACGEDYTFAVANGVLKSWGANAYGQLGDGTNNSRNTPGNVTGISTNAVTQIACGVRHTVVLLVNGVLKSWGLNDSGQLGDGTNNSRNTPGNVTGISTNAVTQIACGDYHTVAVTNGILKSWGANAYGQLGDRTYNSRNTPGNVTEISTNANTQIACGGFHTVAVENGVLKAWGYNAYGGLGDGTTTTKNIPGNVTGISTNADTQIACGSIYTVAVVNGVLKAWGYNYPGSLGDGTTTTQRNTPVNVVGSLDFYPTPREKSRWIFEGLPRLPKQDPTLTSEGTFLNAVKGTFTTAYQANRQLYISINNNGTIASFSYTTTQNSGRTFILDFTTQPSGSASFKMGTDTAISLTDATLLKTTGLPSNITPSTADLNSFYLDRFANASFSIKIYDAVYPTEPIATANWTQINTPIPAGNYTISSVNNSTGAMRFLGPLATAAVTRPQILRIEPSGNAYIIRKSSTTNLTAANQTPEQWYTYSQYVNSTSTLSRLGNEQPINGKYLVSILKDNTKVLTTSTTGSLTLPSTPPTTSINTAANIFAINPWANMNQQITVAQNSDFKKAILTLGDTTISGGWSYGAFPHTMQIDISGVGGSAISTSAKFTTTNVSLNFIRINYGQRPTIDIDSTNIITFNSPIYSTDSFVATVYILDPYGNPVKDPYTSASGQVASEGYFARGTLTGIAAAVNASGKIVREEVDNGTRIKFQLPLDKSLLAGTILQLTASTTDTSTDTSIAQTTIPLQVTATGVSAFYLRFYDTQDTPNNAFIDINDTSYPLTPAITSDVINYYSNLTLYAYRAPFAAAITTSYDYKFATNATPEPSLTGSLAITASTASTTTLTGSTSASLPGRSNKFPKYMKLYLKAKNETLAREIPYNCTTDAPSFTISTLTPTSTDTTTQATIQFGTNSAISLGEVLTSADTFELTIDDAISATSTGYYQKYTYAPPSLIIFDMRSNVEITGSIKQSIARNTDYRNIPRQATLEFAINGTGSSAAQTVVKSPKLGLTVDAPEFTLSFSVGTGAAKLTVGSQTVDLTGVTLYNYHTFTLTIKDAVGGEFAHGVASSECQWDVCKAAIAEAKRTYTAFDAATSPLCNGCFLTDSYNPCTASGDCENEQNRLTASFVKWAGSDIKQCNTCGEDLKGKQNDPCKSASCAAAKARAASSYQPYSASDLSDCAYCPTGTGGADSYNPCTASGDCENEQSRLTASFIKWSGSDIPHCNNCETLKAKQNDPCKSILCAAAKARAASLYQPYSASDLSDCAYCPTGTGGADSYNPCTASGDCESEQSRLTAIPKKWSGSEILACQACGSMKDSKYDPCRSASCGAAKSQAASAYLAYSASDLRECDYCPPETGGADTYDPCSASGDCATVQAALTASMRAWEGKDIPQCQQCGSLKQGSFYPCFSTQCAAAQKRMTASYIPWNSTDIPECDNCTASELVGSYDPCSASGGPCERRQTELTALGISWNAADLNECKYCAELAGSWAPTASASMPTASASIAPAPVPASAPAPAPVVGGGIFAVFQGAVAPTPIAAAPRPPMPLKPIKPVPTYTPAVQERTVTVIVNEKKTGAAKTPAKHDYCIDGRKGFLANLACEIRGDVVGVGGKVKQVFGLF